MKKIITVFTVILMMFMLTACGVNPRLKSAADDFVEITQSYHDYAIRITECKTTDEAMKMLDDFDVEKYEAEYENITKRVYEITEDIKPSAADRKYIEKTLEKIEQLEEERKTALKEFFESKGVDIPEDFKF